MAGLGQLEDVLALVEDFPAVHALQGHDGKPQGALPGSALPHQGIGPPLGDGQARCRSAPGRIACPWEKVLRTLRTSRRTSSPAPASMARPRWTWRGRAGAMGLGLVAEMAFGPDPCREAVGRAGTPPGPAGFSPSQRRALPETAGGGRRRTCPGRRNPRPRRGWWAAWAASRRSGRRSPAGKPYRDAWARRARSPEAPVSTTEPRCIT